jgi:hypothetical protein
MAFMNDRCSVFLVLGLAGESELVLGLAVGDLVDTVGGGEEISGKREVRKRYSMRRGCFGI